LTFERDSRQTFYISRVDPYDINYETYCRSASPKVTFSIGTRHKQKNLRRKLNSIQETAFKKCFNVWIIRWRKCIVSEEAYFEGDKINLDE
jgi:hypothetical protein